MISSVVPAATASSDASPLKFSSGNTSSLGPSADTGPECARAAAASASSAGAGGAPWYHASHASSAAARCDDAAEHRAAQQQPALRAPHLRRARRGSGRGSDGRRGERRRVAVLRQRDADRVDAALAVVVLDQAAAQPSGLHAHERIGLGVELGRLAEHLDRDRIALEPIRAAREGLLDDEPQELGRPARLREYRAAEHSRKLGLDLLRARERGRVAFGSLLGMGGWRGFGAV